MHETQEKRAVKTVDVLRKDLSGFGGQESQSPEYRFRKQEFNAAGNLLSQITFLPNGRPVEEVITEYTPHGNIKSQEVKHHQEGTSEKTVLEYNEKGKVAEEIVYFNGELYERVVSSYDESGFETGRERFDDEGNTIEREVYTKDAEGRRIKQEHYNEEGILDWFLETKYNEQKQASEEVTHFPAENTQEISKHQYNEKGLRTRTELADESGEVVSLSEITYDEQGRQIKLLSSTRGYYPSEIVHQTVFDESGNIIEEEWYDVLHGYLIGKNLSVYNDFGFPKSKEVFEIKPNHATQKTHYRIEMNYEYFTEQTE